MIFSKECNNFEMSFIRGVCNRTELAMFKHIIYGSDKLITKKPNTKDFVPNEKFRESSVGETKYKSPRIT